jgi:LuxR family maltose regulon positive regulatory protein
MNVYQLVCMGHVEQAWHTASLLGIHLDSKPDERTIAQILIFLRATIARGIELDAAETLMIATAETAAGIGSKLMSVEARALAAWRYLRMNQPAEAENELAAALDIASKTGYVRHILDIPDLAPLLATMQHPAAERCWIATIPESQRHSAARLTNQERRVLSQLASRLRYQDIADAQDITINTVRTHVRHIYAKLGVNSRQDAIARARIMGFEQNE